MKTFTKLLLVLFLSNSIFFYFILLFHYVSKVNIIRFTLLLLFDRCNYFVTCTTLHIKNNKKKKKTL